MVSSLRAISNLDRLSVVLPSIVRPYFWYVVSGGFVRQSSELFSPEAVCDTLVSYAWRDLVLPDTLVGYAWRVLVLPDHRVATPQLCEELRTLPVEVSFTHGLTHVLTCSLKNNIAPIRH